MLFTHTFANVKNTCLNYSIRFEMAFLVERGLDSLITLLLLLIISE